MDTPYSTPTASTSLPEAPGAKGARICGILAIIFAVLCVGIPVAIVLGIVALVLHSKAKRLATESPETYRMPTNSGMVLGIVGLCTPVIMLPFAGIVSAIAIPAILGQRARARDRVVMLNLTSKVQELTMEYEKAVSGGATGAQVQAAMEEYLSRTTASEKNPHDASVPAYAPTLKVVQGQMNTDDMEMTARREGEYLLKGQVLFLVQFGGGGAISNPTPTFLAGAGKLGMPYSGSTVYVKVVQLD
jgi:hypothetical protein